MVCKRKSKRKLIQKMKTIEFKKFNVHVKVVMFLLITMLPSLGLAQTIFPTGTTIYNPAESHSSYILISDHNAVGNHQSARVREAETESPGDIRLIDMNGNVVHTWQVAPYFNKRTRLLPNGNLVCVGPDKTIYEYDWDGNVVWKHAGIGSMNDMRILPNGNHLLIAHEPIPEEAGVTVMGATRVPFPVFGISIPCNAGWFNTLSGVSPTGIHQR